MINLQVAVLRHDPGFSRLRDKVMEIAGLLEEYDNIPMVRAELPLIEEVQSPEWWQDVTVAMLEHVRKRLRSLVRFIEKRKRKVLYTDFTDEMREPEVVHLPGGAPRESMEHFRAKVQAFLRQHEDQVAIHRLRMNKPLTATDLLQLEHILLEAGVADPEHLEQAKIDAQGLGLFVRSLVGLHRGAAKEAFAGFLEGKTLNANQIHFIDLVVNHRTERGVMPIERLYESPFTDVSPHGPDGLFPASQVDNLVSILRAVRSTALAG